MKLKRTQLKKSSPILILSGIIIAVSFLLMLIPLAVFCIAQMSAMLGKKISLGMMLLVSFLLICVGLGFSSQIFLGSGILTLFSVPFFLSAISLREKCSNIVFPAFILSFPVVLGLTLFCFVLPGEAHFLNEVEQSFQQMNLDTSSEQFIVINQFLHQSGWQRLLWFVFGPGSYSLFVALLISFANLALIDFAFEQVDRLKSVISYVMKNHSRFPLSVVKLFVSMPMAKSNQHEPFVVKAHSRLDRDSEQPSTSKWGGWIKPIQKQKTMRVKDHLFFFDRPVGCWNLRQFSVPFPLILLSIAFMAFVAFAFGGFDQILSQAGKNSFWLHALPLAGLFSLAVLSILTLQGMYILYLRLPSFLALLFLFCAFILVPGFSFGPYALVAVFGTISILDSVYDWRGKKFDY